jgi:hypothetical protein
MCIIVTATHEHVQRGPDTLEIPIAPSSGVQRSFKTGLTFPFLHTMGSQVVAERVTTAMTTKGAGMQIPSTGRVEIAARGDMVTTRRSLR